jgi:CHAD domain-containing protein
VNAGRDYPESVASLRETIERELKLTPQDGFVMPQLGGEPLRTRVFVSTYHDTADLQLARNGITFRHRIEDGAGLWQLKLPHGAARNELELAGPPARPPQEMTSLLVAHLRGRELVPVARLRTRREGVRANGAEVVEDSVSVLEGVRVTRRFREVEVELLEGDERTLRRLEKQLREAGAGAADPTPKLYRALDLAGPSEPFVVYDDALPREALAILLREQARRMLAHDPGTRLGSDPEDLHQLRVATRRSRAFLRAARPLVDRAWAEGLRAELAWLAGALGPARDLDVLLEHLRVAVAALEEDADVARPVLDDVERERGDARAAVVEALSSERYFALLDRLEDIDDTTIPPGAGNVSLGSLWAAEMRRARRDAHALGPESTDDELHAFRIRVKRVRYAAELAAHELGKRGARVVSAAKTVQDVLGEHQDGVVAEARIRAAVGANPGAGFAAGRLVERERRRRERMRSRWRDAWLRLDRKARRVRA